MTFCSLQHFNLLEVQLCAPISEGCTSNLSLAVFSATQCTILCLFHRRSHGSKLRDVEKLINANTANTSLLQGVLKCPKFSRCQRAGDATV